jgi:hypothetical protein
VGDEGVKPSDFKDPFACATRSGDASVMGKYPIRRSPKFNVEGSTVVAGEEPESPHAARIELPVATAKPAVPAILRKLRRLGNVDMMFLCGIE